MATRCRVPTRKVHVHHTHKVKVNRRGNVEVKFARKPADCTRSSLHKAGFKWTPKYRLWYATANAETTALAHVLAGRVRKPAPRKGASTSREIVRYTPRSAGARRASR